MLLSFYIPSPYYIWVDFVLSYMLDELIFLELDSTVRCQTSPRPQVDKQTRCCLLTKYLQEAVIPLTLSSLSTPEANYKLFFGLLQMFF